MDLYDFPSVTMFFSVVHDVGSIRHNISVRHDVSFMQFLQLWRDI
jgi:hypothetical protein